MSAIKLKTDELTTNCTRLNGGASSKQSAVGNQPVLRRIFRPVLLLMVALALSEARSETLVVGTNQPVNFSLTVPTNQAVVIYGGRFVTWDPNVYWRIRQFGQQHLFRMDSSLPDPILGAPAGHPNILAGPLILELSIPTEKLSPYDGSWMSYEVLPLAGLKTLIVPPLGTNRVAVSSGTNFRLVGRTLRDPAMGTSWELVSGSARANLGMESVSLILDMEFSGPIDLEISNTTERARWFTYSLHGGAVQRLPEGVIAASGVNALSVEESSDLMNWSAAAVILKHASPGRFYRLKVSR